MKSIDKPTHGGKRKGAGRKPALFPLFLKKLRATDEEREEFASLLTGDARKDFLVILNAVRIWRKRNKTLTTPPD
jgi:hypothetical protein